VIVVFEDANSLKSYRSLIPTQLVNVEAAFIPDSWLEVALRELEAMRQLEANWDGRGSEAPNDLALANSKRVLLQLSDLGFPPRSINASAGDGIAIYFLGPNGQRADMEMYNSGEIVATIGEPDSGRTFELANDESDIKGALEEMRQALYR